MSQPDTWHNPYYAAHPQDPKWEFLERQTQSILSQCQPTQVLNRLEITRKLSERKGEEASSKLASDLIEYCSGNQFLTFG